ncbi:hypothetical protein MKQ68_17515 [Chitinophaga horti]|uniref:Uncharacterized protein n=1 Tax=Chitinophaga horti TaxID=2920382 RepID=A0ABY6IXD0_9BACT|nr:hypothetical protein [Chitinophaga horti]UYQ91888.1 hypothetical protein MKQ68_17515 [Chitinophaga horti]
MKSVETSSRTNLRIASSRQELALILERMAAELQAGKLDFVCYTGEKNGFLLELKCIPFDLNANHLRSNAFHNAG